MQFFVAFLTGVVFFYSYNYFPVATLFVFLLFSVSLFLKKRVLLVFILVCGTAFAFLRYEPEVEIPYVKDKVDVRGVFISYPAKTERGDFKQTFSVASAENVDTGERLTAMSGKEIVLFSERAFDPGMECELGVTILKSRKRLNPGEVTREEPRANLSDIYSEKAGGPSLYLKIQGYRHRLDRYLEENMEKDSGAFVAAITTGRMNNMSEEVRDAFSVTGLAHILSISGSHFGLFSVFLFGIFSFGIKSFPYRFLQRMTIYLTPSQAAAILCLPFMLAYLGLSGASIPAVRSFIMIGLFLFGLIIGKKGYWLNSLLFAAFIIVVWDPEAVFDLSFQLSFIAVLFIGFAVQHSEADKKSGKIFGYIRDSLLMTLSASIGTAPLVAYYFHYFSVISPISNLIVAPLIGFLLIPLSVISCFLYLITGHFIFTPVVSLFSDISIAAVKFLSGVPYAGVSVPAFPPILLILFYSGCIVYLVLNNKARHKKENNVPDDCGPPETGDTKGSLSENDVQDNAIGHRRIRFRKYLVMAPLVPLVVYFLLSVREKNGLSVTFLDVGQGDAAVAELPDGKTMIIDTGRTGRETASFLKYRGKKTVDVLVLSHVHPDHTGGLDTIQNGFRVKEIWDNGRILYPNKMETRSLMRGDVIEGNGYRICALHPYPEFYTMEKSECVSENNDSLVLRIEGNALSFLFTGDIEEEAEQDVAHLGRWMRSNVMKIPHHGGKTSACGSLIAAVCPDIAVISAGRDNSFGHPHQEMLDILPGIQVYRTDIDGAVKISESVKGVEIKTYRESRLRKAESFPDEMKNFAALVKTW
jgi:competence protein ComEC